MHSDTTPFAILSTPLYHCLEDLTPFNIDVPNEREAKFIKQLQIDLTTPIAVDTLRLTLFVVQINQSAREE